MAVWLSPNQYSKSRVFEKTGKDAVYFLSPKSTLNLMQNCDLPPPMKVFSDPDGLFQKSMSKITAGIEVEDEKIRVHKDFSSDDKLEILKALRLSQTRAREAERKLRILTEEKEKLAKLVVDESMRAFAYRQWVNVMEIRVLSAEKLLNFEDCDDGDCGGRKWCTVIAFCLAIAGMSIAFGCGYLF